MSNFEKQFRNSIEIITKYLSKFLVRIYRLLVIISKNIPRINMDVRVGKKDIT